MDKFNTFFAGGLLGVLLLACIASIVGTRKENVIEQYQLCLEAGASVEYCEKI